jgi:hypothetical protein
LFAATMGFPWLIAIDAFELRRELRSQAVEKLDALPMAEQGGTGGIEVRPETRRTAKKLLHGRGVRIGRVHLTFEALEFCEGEIGGAAERGRGLHTLTVRVELGRREGDSAGTGQVRGQDVRGGV